MVDMCYLLKYGTVEHETHTVYKEPDVVTTEAPEDRGDLEIAQCRIFDLTTPFEEPLHINSLPKGDACEAQDEHLAGTKPRPVSNKLSNQVYRYNRYGQERYERGVGATAGFNIDTHGSYQAPLFPRYRAGGSMIYYNVFDAQMVPRHKQAVKSSPLVNPKPKEHMPIIIVPMASTALLNIYNALKLLRDYRYVPPLELKRRGDRRNDNLIAERQHGQRRFKYRITDTPYKLSESDWNDVVAVFVHGPAWQFKGWPWHGDPLQIMQNICGFYLHYKGMKPQREVKKWSLTMLEISQDYRHMDTLAVSKFWNKVVKFMSHQKPSLWAPAL